MATEMEKRILRFLASHNDGQCRSSDLLFADFLKTYTVEFIRNQKLIQEAINSCFEKGFIENDEYPAYFIHITKLGRNQI